MKRKVSLSDVGAYILLGIISLVLIFGWDPAPAGVPVSSQIESN